MNLRNRVQLIGNLGANPQVRVFENGNKMVRFTVATTDVYKKDDKLIKETQWHNVVTWEKTAEIAEKNLIVGSEVVIDGRLIQRSYLDKDGVKKYITEVVANTIMFTHKTGLNAKSEQVVEKRA
jgi:single-strand DNA-binding protein